MKRKICIFSALLLISININVSAHEKSTSAYYRWHDVSYNSSIWHNVVNLKWNKDYVKDTNQIDSLKSAISKWEYNDNGYCSFTLTDFSNSEVDFSDTWPSEYGLAFGANTVTNHYNEVKGTDGNIYRIMNYSIIYSNKDYQNIYKFNTFDREHNWVHEIGHTIGFGETPFDTVSVMNQGKASTFTWPDSSMPKEHDKSDLKAFYYSTPWN